MNIAGLITNAGGVLCGFGRESKCIRKMYLDARLITEVI
jgi:hypothetical protein